MIDFVIRLRVERLTFRDKNGTMTIWLGMPSDEEGNILL